MENALRHLQLYQVRSIICVLILIFLENALRLGQFIPVVFRERVLILIFLENALRRLHTYTLTKKQKLSLNPYFFGKCSTAAYNGDLVLNMSTGLNPYFFGKCSTANSIKLCTVKLRGLNPYFFGKCSTAYSSQLYLLY